MEELINKLINSDLKYVEKQTGIPYDRMYKWVKGKSKPKMGDYQVLVDFFDGKKSIEKVENPRLEAVPINLHPHHDDDESGDSKYVYSPDGSMGMRVKIVPAKAQAGYWLGHADPEYFDEFETVIIDVKQKHRGTYIGFEVRGDSMMTTDPELMEQNIYPGWRAIGRDLPKDKWTYKLHTHHYDKWIIVHRDKGILIKQITEHDVQQRTITIHSLNPEYKDEVLKLEDIDQIFSVVQTLPKQRN
ncbi:hypothetical protein J3L18_00205 [Mucilaginibacter gossypii]|uniref:S24 family peptidase n=1 Tax=Mucilaginibacter gossypii TaxID=551996 RepID=UPI000DCDEA66|nr:MULTISPECIES: hypothetical protein [Mucilaginibacter]QTE37525.1 hypothetical protein J3L18_00205 [Mucilaginibacter gossypii]RAV52351.1 hypothetical protein DIU36_24765 [Mucilaginibacter rubeus]